METKKQEIRRRLLSIIGILTFLIIMTVGFYIPKKENLLSSIAFLQTQKKLVMEDLSSGILLKDATPVTDETGMKNDPYTFKIVNNSKQEITYNIVFTKNSEKVEKQGKKVLENKYLRYTIQENKNNYLSASTLNEEGIIYTAKISPKSEIVFNFKMWLDYDADNEAMNKVFIGSIKVEEIK